MFHLSNSLGLSNLFTDCLPRLPSKQRLSCSPCAARLKTSSSTTPGPVISHDLWIPWQLSSCKRVNVCQKVMLLRLLQWPLCGDWSQATPPSSRTKRCASSLWQLDFLPDEVCLLLKYELGVATLRCYDLRLKTCLHLTWGLVMSCELLVMSCELLVACCCTCLKHACRRHLVAAIGQTCIMWTELQRSGIFDDVAQWHLLSYFSGHINVFLRVLAVLLPWTSTTNGTS